MAGNEPDQVTEGCPEKEKNWVDIEYQYADGSGIGAAPYTIYEGDTQTVLASGSLGGDGTAHVALPVGKDDLRVEYKSDPQNVAALIPHTPISVKDSPNWFERISTNIKDAGEWTWGVIEGDYNENPTVGQIITNAVVTAIPLVDQVADARDLTAAVKQLVWDKRYTEAAVWFALFITLIGLIPTVGSLLKGVLKLVWKGSKLGDLLKIFNHLMKGNGIKWLEQLRDGKLASYAKESAGQASKMVSAAAEKANDLKKLVPDSLSPVHQQITDLLGTLQEVQNRINGQFDDIASELSKKLDGILKEEHTQFSKGNSKAKLTNRQTAEDKSQGIDVSAPKFAKVEKEVIALQAGKASGKRGVKGTWHTELEDPKPNTIYEVTSIHDGKPVTYKYETDEQGRTVKVSGKLKISAIKDGTERDKVHRNTTTQSEYGGDDSNYDGGHLIGTLFQGPAEKVNLVPQLSSQNRYGAWRKMEKGWAKQLRAGNEVEVEILVEYGDDGVTPAAFHTNTKINSERATQKSFPN